jgi:hypothetical protein
VAVARGTHPGLHWLGYRARRARASHPSGSRLRDDPRGSVPSPWLKRAPENRRYPIVSNWLAVVRNRDDGRTGSWLAALKTAPHLFWLTIEAYPPGHAGAAFGDVVPRCFPEGKKPMPTPRTPRHNLRYAGSETAASISTCGSKPDRCLGSPPPSSMAQHLIQKPSSYRTLCPP